MTIRELIESLSKIEDQDIRVMVKGYEGGYDDVVNINPTPIEIALDVNEEWYFGKHEKAKDIHGVANSRYQIVKAIIL
jgi:hypothetical protein